MLERLGQYRVERELGRGGMGAVYKAHDGRTGETVALKVLPPELARNAQFFNRFRREVRTLRTLDHPGIVRILDVGSEEGLQYYAMEYVDGPTLQAVLEREGRLDPIRACEIGIDLCDALEHAHSRGVVHRDLKPANILIDSSGRAHLTDFGIAKVIEATRMTTTGGIVGTAEYMSPEQAEGRSVDRRSDLYSLAVVLYRAMTGRVPFQGETVLDIIRQHRYAVLESPKELNPEIPGTLSALLEQMLEKDPARRPPSAAVVRRALEAAHRMLEAGGGELAEILWQKTAERRREEEAELRRAPFARAALYLAASAAMVLLALWWTRPPSAADLLERGRRNLQRRYYLSALVNFEELLDRYPGAPQVEEARRLAEEARRRHYEHGKDIQALVEGLARGLARGVVAAADVDVPDPEVSAGDIAYARALRDKRRGDLEAARLKFGAVTLLFAEDEPLIAASARRQADEIAARLRASSRPATAPAGVDRPPGQGCTTPSAAASRRALPASRPASRAAPPPAGAPASRGGLQVHGP